MKGARKSLGSTIFFVFVLSLFYWNVIGTVSAQTITVGTVSPTTVCSGSTILIPITATAGFQPGNFFTAELSDAAGSFASPIAIGTLIGTTNGTIVGTVPVSIPTGNNYRIRVRAEDPAVMSGNTSVAIRISAQAGDPSVFGNNEWRVYAFDGNILAGTAEYRGFYTETNLSFNSAARWAQGNTPSVANATGGAAYQGCDVALDFHSVSYKRRGFPCGFYQVDIIRTDTYQILIDGVVVATNTGSGTINNRWRGLLGPNTEMEIRWYDDTAPNVNSRFQATFNILAPEALVVQPVLPICANTQRTVNLITSTTANNPIDFRVNPTAYTFTWSGPAGFTTNADGTSMTTAIGGHGTYTLTATHNTNGCSISTNVVVALAPPPSVAVTPTSPTICAGERVTLTATGATTYSWRNAATNVQVAMGATVTLNPLVTTTYNVIGSDGCTNTTTTFTINVNPAPTDPGTFGDGFWFVACYDGNNFDRYYGYYTENNLSFSASDRWPIAGSPSSANAASGLPYTSPLSCTVPVDQHSVSYRRRNFPCGYYRITTRQNDDQGYLLVNGVVVWERLSSSTTAVTAWEGFLGAGSTVEFRWREGTGNSRGSLEFTTIVSELQPLTSPATVTICQGTSTTAVLNPLPVQRFFNAAGDPTGQGAATPVSWSVITGSPADFTITPNATGAVITADNTPSPNPATIRYRFTDPASGCVVDKTLNIRVDPLPSPAIVASATTICVGGSVNLTASGANTYAWYDAATGGNLLGTGLNLTVSPTTTTTYRLEGNNNCATIAQTITITVLGPTLAGTEFGNDEWIAHSYDGALITDPGNAIYRGHYTHKSLSFDSRSRWAQNLSPSAATTTLPDGSAAYIGCAIGNDNHSISFRRTNFPCGFYVISVGRDDRFVLRINGVQVAASAVAGFTPNVWEGLLDESSNVELVIQEGTGNSYGQISIGFLLGSTTQSVWRGGVSSDWFNALNWCPQVPTATTDVVIPGAGVTFMPIIDEEGAVTKDLQIAAGATLTILGTRTLEVHGSYLQEGILVANNSTITLQHNTTPNDITVQVSGTGAFYNLVVNKLAHQVQLNSPITINGQLRLTNGELNLNTRTLTITNPATTAIVRENNAFIRSETNAANNTSIVCWETGTTTGTYVYPFGTAPNADGYIPLSIHKTAITTNTRFCVATRATATFNNVPYATGTNMNSVVGGGPLFVVDRWWNITSSVNPLPAPGVDITFRYRGVENTLPAPANTEQLAVQKFEASFNDWESPFSGGANGVTTGVGAVQALGVRRFSPFVITLASTPLPVTLINFDARAINNDRAVQLDWSTAYEQNNQMFVLERSGDGERFEPFARVLPDTSPIGVRRYQHVDDAPLAGTSYYRLVQVDISGQANPQRIVSVSLRPDIGLQVLPNPSDGYFVQLRLHDTPNATVQVNFVSISGNRIHQLSLQTDAAGFWQGDVRFPVKLSTGAYIVETKSGEHRFSQKFIVH
ncbi:T9SS type A sorting domain-containing protein [Eisenibacter elegans]|uniref:Ig-like domain-containing protein n=1 Tax=Eisenibacter elegans TaxID=997 RepID=UPI00047C52B5|nr:T9SS type A sorting domain-containing protein [Eisenibacter elegans]